MHYRNPKLSHVQPKRVLHIDLKSMTTQNMRLPPGFRNLCRGGGRVQENGYQPIAEVQVLVIKGDEDVSNEGGQGRQGPAYHLGPRLLDDHLVHPLPIRPLHSTEGQPGLASALHRQRETQAHTDRHRHRHV